LLTETGNYTILNNDSRISENVQATLIMDTLLDDFKSGVVIINSRTFTVSLLTKLPRIITDFSTSTKRRRSIHNLTTILQDNASMRSPSTRRH